RMPTPWTTPPTFWSARPRPAPPSIPSCAARPASCKPPARRRAPAGSPTGGSATRDYSERHPGRHHPPDTGPSLPVAPPRTAPPAGPKAGAPPQGEGGRGGAYPGVDRREFLEAYTWADDLSRYRATRYGCDVRGEATGAWTWAAGTVGLDACQELGSEAVWRV